MHNSLHVVGDFVGVPTDSTVRSQFSSAMPGVRIMVSALSDALSDQVAGRIESVKPVPEILSEKIAEFEAVVAKLAALLA